LGQLAAVPPELEWRTNITKSAYPPCVQKDVDEFVAFSGLGSFAELRGISLTHVIAGVRIKRWGGVSYRRNMELSRFTWPTASRYGKIEPRQRVSRGRAQSAEALSEAERGRVMLGWQKSRSRKWELA